MENEPPYFVEIVCFIIFMCSVISFYSWKRTRRFIEESQETCGTVIGLHEDVEGSFAAIIRFKSHEGDVVEFTDNYYSGEASAYRVGSSIKIRYNTKNPSCARIATFPRLYFVSIIFLFIVLFCSTSLLLRAIEGN